MRDSAVDDYKAIRERMEQLKGKKQPKTLTQAEIYARAGGDPNWDAMTFEQISRFIAKTFTCQSTVIGPYNCGQANGNDGITNSAISRCWAAGKCMTLHPPRHP